MTQVICEGFSERSDKLKLRGSCGLEYSLHFTSIAAGSRIQEAHDVKVEDSFDRNAGSHPKPSHPGDNNKRASIGLGVWFVLAAIVAGVLCACYFLQQASEANRLHDMLRMLCDREVLPEPALVEMVPKLRKKGVTVRWLRRQAGSDDLALLGLPPDVCKSIIRRREELDEQERIAEERRRAEEERRRVDRLRSTMRGVLRECCDAYLLPDEALREAAELVVSKGVDPEQVRLSKPRPAPFRPEWTLTDKHQDCVGTI